MGRQCCCCQQGIMVATKHKFSIADSIDKSSQKSKSDFKKVVSFVFASLNSSCDSYDHDIWSQHIMHYATA